MSKIIISFLLAPVFFMVFCNNKGNADAGNDKPVSSSVQWKEILSGQGSSIVVDSQVVCKDQAAFDKIWSAAFTDYPGQYEKPVTDFSKNFLLCCFMGNVKSAGYAIKIKKVEEAAGQLKVFIEYTEPRPGCMNASVIETPFTIISIAENAGRTIEYVKEKSITKCD